MATKDKNTTNEIQKTPHAHGLSRFEDLDRMFENFFSRGWLRPFNFDWPQLGEIPQPFEGKMPHVDMIERDGEVVIKAELPGVDKKDLDITVTRNTVTIKGETSHETREEKGEYRHREISRGSYMRTLTLPTNVDENKSRAKFRDGVLELVLPKLEETKRHTVKVE